MRADQKYPRQIIIAPCHDLRQKVAVVVKSFEEVLNAQRARYEILEDLGEVKAIPKKDIHCNFCGGELGDVEHQKHDNPNFAEYRTCLKCGYQWAKEYWAWLAKVQGVEA